MSYDDLRPYDDPASEAAWLAGDRGTFKMWRTRFKNFVDRVLDPRVMKAIPDQLTGGFLFRCASSSVVLKGAWDYLERRGGQAPGPDRLRYGDFVGPDRWDACRAIGDAIRDRTYRPGEERDTPIPKLGGEGVRTITLQSVIDRVVQRAVASVLHPLLDPDFDPLSFAYRPGHLSLPGRSRQHALAAAQALAFGQGRFAWVVADVKDAFGSVSLDRLADVLRLRIPDTSLLDLIETTLVRTARGASAKRGLRQGGSLSPLLLNVYLDHFLDRPWREKHPDVPLLRYADDVLLMCRDAAEAEVCLVDLRLLLRPAGMTLKDSPGQDHALDLADGDEANWLGFRVSKDRTDLSIRPAKHAYARLTTRLLLAHEAARPAVAADAVFRGWLDQMGPCSKSDHRSKVYAKAVAVASAAGFDEIPDEACALKLWSKAYDRWNEVVKRTGKDVATS